MSPTFAESTPAGASFPRVSGDEPAAKMGRCAVHEFSPRERG